MLRCINSTLLVSDPGLALIEIRKYFKSCWAWHIEASLSWGTCLRKMFGGWLEFEKLCLQFDTWTRDRHYLAPRHCSSRSCTFNLYTNHTSLKIYHYCTHKHGLFPYMRNCWQIFLVDLIMHSFIWFLCLFYHVDMCPLTNVFWSFKKLNIKVTTYPDIWSNIWKMHVDAVVFFVASRLENDACFLLAEMISDGWVEWQ